MTISLQTECSNPPPSLCQVGISLSPVLERAVVAVRHKHVSNAVVPLLPQLLPIEVEGADVGRCEALDEVLLDASRRCAHDVHHLVLTEVPVK